MPDQPIGRTNWQTNFCVCHLHSEQPERVWHALTDAELSGEYWGHSNISDWEVGVDAGSTGGPMAPELLM